MKNVYVTGAQHSDLKCFEVGQKKMTVCGIKLMHSFCHLESRTGNRDWFETKNVTELRGSHESELHDFIFYFLLI